MSQPYSSPNNSLIVSHCKIQHETRYLRGLLADSTANPQWWGVLAAVKDLVQMRAAHIETLYECNMQLAEIHWTVTPMIQAAIIRNRMADDQQAGIRRLLHRQLCVQNNDTPLKCAELEARLLMTRLHKFADRLLASLEFEKTTVFKLFEIIEANIEIHAVSSK